jgi:membrane-bound serine protease (ClpP class)
MPFKTWLIWGLLALVAGAQQPRDPRELQIEEKFDRVLVLAMSSGQVIDDALFLKIRTELETAAVGGRTAVVLEIDSPGGLVDAARNISNLIRSYREHEDIRIFAYVPSGSEAISAAAWLALACKGLLIAPDAAIGDIQPIEMGLGAFRDVDEKVVTKTAEDVWIAARDNGLRGAYPQLFVRAMVDKDLDIVALRNPMLDNREEFMRGSEFRSLPRSQSRDLVMEEITLPGKTLTTNGADLLRFGFQVRMAGDRDSLLDTLGTPTATLEIRSLATRPAFGGVELNWGFLLLVAGIVFLVLEFQAPGLGVFGILGLLSLAGFFLLQADFESSAVMPIALLLVGVLLLLFELVLMPGLIFPGLVGIALVLYALWFGIAQPEIDGSIPLPNFAREEDRSALRLWALSVIAAVVGGFGLSLTAGKFLHHIPWLGKMVIMPPEKFPGRSEAPAAAASGSAVATGGLALGARGTAETDLRPAGRARIAGRRIDVVSRGGFIESGSAIAVCEIAGNRVVVRLLTHEEMNS